MDWLQLGAPFVAAALTAWGGLVVYRSQKRIDRGERFHEEKRKVYHDFIIQSADFTNSIHVEPGLKTVQADQAKLEKAFEGLAVLSLYSSESVMNVATDFLYELEGRIGTEELMPELTTKTTIKDLSEAMREDLLKKENEK